MKTLLHSLVEDKTVVVATIVIQSEIVIMAVDTRMMVENSANLWLTESHIWSLLWEIWKIKMGSSYD